MSNNTVAGMVVIISILCVLRIIPIDHYTAFMGQRIVSAVLSYAFLPIVAIITGFISFFME